MRGLVAWVLVALCGGWVVVRVLGLERGWPLVPLVAFTPFVAGAAVAVVVLAALLRQRGAALVAAVLAVVLVGVVAPRALGGPSEPDGSAGPELRVLSANMHYGDGSPEQLVALARRTRADVVSVQELSPRLARDLEAAGIGKLLPEQILQPGGRGAGIGLYSRLPLGVAEPGGERRNPLVLAGVQVEGAPAVEIAAVHPPPPLRRALPAWHGDLQALPPATPGGRLRILAGDFNATLDHAELRRLLDTGYVDAAAEVGAGLKGTWPHGRRFPPPVAIDHVLVDSRAGVKAFSVHAITGTDHRAVFAQLVLPRG
jgi:endonuclease/exonuclease/phosphatase (EEP) superfamily protein YafD